MPRDFFYVIREGKEFKEVNEKREIKGYNQSCFLLAI